MAEPALGETDFFYNEPDSHRTLKLKRLLLALIAAEIVTTNEAVAALADLVLTGQSGKVVTVNLAGTGFEFVTPTYLTNGDKGDIVVSGGGAVWTLDPTVVSAFARTFLDDANGAAVRATIGAAAASHTHTASEVTDFSEAVDDRVNALLAGTQIIRTYDDAAGTITLTIADDAVTNAKLANMAEATLKGRVAGAGTGDPTDLTATQVRILLGGTGSTTGTGSLVFSAAPTFTGVVTVGSLSCGAIAATSGVFSTSLNVSTAANASLFLTCTTAKQYSVTSSTDGNLYIGNQTDGLNAVILLPTGAVSFAGAVRAKSYTVAALPSVSVPGAGAMIYVSNESGGAVLAFSDGAAWRRVTDRAIVS
jgi:hypothetical protein